MACRSRVPVRILANQHDPLHEPRLGAGRSRIPKLPDNPLIVLAMHVELVANILSPAAP